MRLEDRQFLDSRFVIDGAEMPLTPAGLLGLPSEPSSGEPVVDETLDPECLSYPFDGTKIDVYLREVLKAGPRAVQYPFSEAYTRCVCCDAILDALWTGGHFVLGDLTLSPRWSWSAGEIGSMAAFYGSVRALAEFADSLDLKVDACACTPGKPSLEVAVPNLSERIIPSVLQPDPESWVIYVPFDTAPYRLGGSLLARSLSLEGGNAPQQEDPDYLIDCYEVVREFVEDGILLSAVTVGAGGLMTALHSVCGGEVGLQADISELKSAYPGSDDVSLLFGENPGVVIQISDDDFDYIDAEFLLQDVMYFPLGHPVTRTRSLKIVSSAENAISGILSSLIA